MIGLVLCGGESKRMGRDKGLILSGGKPWAAVIAELLQSAGIATYVSVNAVSITAYKPYFHDQQLIIDDQSIPTRGPLTGILTAHKHFPTEDIFVIACDMQNMTIEIIQKLLLTYRNSSDNDVYLFAKNEEHEPLCAIYRSGCLSAVLNQFRSGDHHRFSMKAVFAKYRQFVIELDPDQFKYFDNYNYPEDLNRD